jgi:hypothetical protein
VESWIIGSGIRNAGMRAIRLDPGKRLDLQCSGVFGAAFVAAFHGNTTEGMQLGPSALAFNTP